MAAFALVMAITPGPNNIMVLNSGLQFGVRRSLPHVFGIVVGFAALIAIAFAGVAALVLLNPAVMTLLTLCGGLYMIWLAWRLLRAQSSPAATAAASGHGALRPMTAWGACLFQLVNAKGWAAAVAAVGITARWPVPSSQALLWVLGTTLLVNLPSLLLWNSGGALLRRLLDTPRVRRVFDGVMAALVLATALWMLQPLARSISVGP